MSAMGGCGAAGARDSPAPWARGGGPFMGGRWVSAGLALRSGARAADRHASSGRAKQQSLQRVRADQW